MFLISAILYFKEEPVGYDVYKEGNKFWLEPSMNTHAHIHPPVIEIVITGPDLLISGTSDKDVQEQVERLIKMHDAYEIPNEFSASP